MKFKFAVFGIFSSVVMATALADGASLEAVVYRDANGQLTKESEKNAKQIERDAKKAGFVTLWLTANVVFNPYEDQLSADEIAAQDQMVKDALDEVLQPLVDAGHVWYPADGQHISGPGCLIRANEEGVRQLVADGRILHIFDTSWQFPD